MYGKFTIIAPERRGLKGAFPKVFFYSFIPNLIQFCHIISLFKFLNFANTISAGQGIIIKYKVIPGD